MAWLQRWAEQDSHYLSCRGSGLALEGWGCHQEPCCSGCLVPVIANDESVGLGLREALILLLTEKSHQHLCVLDTSHFMLCTFLHKIHFSLIYIYIYI